MQPDSPMLTLALEYAAAGWPVFPCRPADEEVFNPHTGEYEPKSAKSPYTDNGLKAATRNERIIRRWWSDHPDAMVGVPTGEPSGIWVLDIDRRPDVDGGEALAALEAKNGALPETVTVRTPSGGRHMLFSLPDGVQVRNRGALGHGVDVRGNGGYVVAAGSVMADGRTYEWETRPEKPAEAPQWLLDLVVRRQQETTSVPSLPTRQISTAYVDAAVRAELDDLAATPMGNRNNAVNDAAYSIGTFVGAGALSEAEARAMLQEVARSWGRDIPRSFKTIDNGLKAGMRNPRQTPESEQDDGSLVETGAAIAARLLARTDPEPDQPAEPESEPPEEADTQLAVVATPLEWKDITKLPRRDFLYGVHLIRRYVSVTVAPGGLGKSSLTMAEALAMITGRPLLGTPVVQPLRVWILNLEDDRDELERRIFAACKHYGITAAELEGRMFLDSGREQEVVVAIEHRRDGYRVMKPIVDAMIENIRRNEIDVVIIDPFVSSHSVPENDNGAIDKVAKLYARIAHETNCAIEIVHHVKKVQDREVSVEDARGASALLSAARSARVLNRMTEEQAAEAGVKPDERFTIFGVQRGKSNLAPLSASSEWRKLESVGLGNGQGMTKPQDHAPVVTEWHWPTAEERTEKFAADITPEQMERIKVKIANGRGRRDSQAKDWAGHEIAEVLGLSTDGEDRKRINGLIKAWLGSGVLEVYTDADSRGQNKDFVRFVD